MQTVDEIIDTILKNEGGYTNDPADRGGPTNWGITLATLRRWRKDPSLTAEDVRLLSKEEARRIYREMYHGQPNFEALPDELEEIVTDFGVMVDPNDAARTLQLTLAELGYTLTADGVVGPKTVGAAHAAIERHGAAKVVNAYVDARIIWHVRNVKSIPRNIRFLEGWINRAIEFRAA